MELPPARRKVNTYGKGPRRIRVHDLFDFGADQSQASKAREAAVPQLRVSDQRNNKSEDDDESEHGGGVDYNPINSTELAKDPLSTATSSPHSSPTEAPNASMFDIDSSEDEKLTTKSKSVRPLKKRRLVHTAPQARTGGDLRQHETESAPNRDSKGQTAGAKGRTQQEGSEGMQKPFLSASDATRRTVPSGQSSTARGLKSIQKLSVTKPSVRAPRKEQSPDGPISSKPAPSKGARQSSGSSENHSDSSNPSRFSRRSTPKRKRGLIDEAASGSASPGDLRITSLRLTPDRTSHRLQLSSDDEPMIDAGATTSPPRRGRQRLIDRLDAPRAQSMGKVGPPGAQDIPHVSSSQPVSGTASPRKLQTDGSSRGVSTSDRPAPALGQPVRQRATYAKQRSHLSEMVDSLDSQPGSNSQLSSQQSFSQHDSFTALTSQLELENEDSDEADGFSQIKSIHELRRGGAIRKFDLDLDTILEDIESDSKSSRVQGLLQLMDKLNDLTFLRHFQDSGNFYRLTECVQDSLDTVSATLIALTFQHMISAEHSSPKLLLQILNALYRLPRQLVLESRSLAKVAKDRSQNFSKLLTREVSEFEGKRSKMSGHSLVASLIVLGSIEGALRHIASLKEALPPMPRLLLGDIFSILTDTADIATEDKSHEQDERVRLVLSLLEIACANNDLAGSTLSSSRISEFGDGVARVMTAARQAQPQIEHSCLRLIVSLSNDEPKVCRALAEGRLITTVFQVIDDHFLRLAGLAAREEEFDHAQLESVILAVGCLQNLTECADMAREKMLELVPGGRSLTDRLVGVFNSHVDQTSEALTLDQTQILVAFGYISALLCTLCLNREACERISTSIKGEGLSQLFGAAQMFLDHLHTVEAVLEEEGGSSSSGFTERFTTVLDTIKQQAQ